MTSFTLSLEKVQHLPCKASASYLFNNLSFSGSHFAFVHQNEVHVTLDTTATKKGTANAKIVAKENSQITQTKWVTSSKGTSNKNHLVITTHSHFQIYDQDCSKALFTYALQTNNFDPTPGKTKYCRGIASVLIQNKTYLLIGTSQGNILVFEYQQGKSKELCTLTQTLTAHAFPICDIASDSGGSSTWASCDTNGNVMLWNGFETKVTSPGSGFSCSSIAVNKQYLICAYGNGVVSVYDSVKGGKLMDIAAHSRCIQAIDLHPSLNVFATVADDSILHLWEITSPTDLAHLKSTSLKDSLLCGVQFCGESYAHLGVVAYDAAQVAVFTR
eukprot:Phypoly_transcript_13888.p1 GENE.Phypoly_transcript_13888~~Phypoly_transcript_13888.p1  ORF type:complete len:337 (+),score=39.49 Phypoly_transcript_13888:24-1013(+)